MEHSNEKSSVTREHGGPNAERHVTELRILNDIARALNGSVDLSTLLKQALERVARFLGLETGWVLLFDEATGEPRMAASQNLPPGFLGEPERMAGWCFCLRSFRDGKFDNPANVGVVRCSRLGDLSAANGDAAGLGFHASIPLQVCVGHASLLEGSRVCGGEDGRFKRLGMLNVASTQWRELSQDELDLLQTIGDMLGVAVERVRLQQRELGAAQTEERNRLAREIHDTIAQDFSAIAFQLEAADAMLDQHAEPQRVRRSIAAALNLTRKGLDETRRSVLDLRAAPLEGGTLAEALAALAISADTSQDPAVSFIDASDARPLPTSVELGLYRIAQEAIRNAFRHAAASRIVVRLEADTDSVRLAVEDDGRGVDLDVDLDAHSDGRFGLVGMRERVRLLGGRFEIEGTSGHGTRITAEVPLRHA